MASTPPPKQKVSAPPEVRKYNENNSDVMANQERQDLYRRQYKRRNTFGIPIPTPYEENKEAWQPGLYETFEFNMSSPNGGLDVEGRRRYTKAKANYNSKRAAAKKGGRRKTRRSKKTRGR